MSRKGNAVEDLLRERAAALVACLAHLIQASGGDFGSFPQKLSSYAAAFVSWKKGDAAALEGDLIKMACDLTASVLCKCGPDLGAEHVVSNPDLSAMVEVIAHNMSCNGCLPTGMAAASRMLRPRGGRYHQGVLDALDRVRRRELRRRGDSLSRAFAATI